MKVKKLNAKAESFEAAMTKTEDALIKAVETMETAAHQTKDINTFKILEIGIGRIKETLQKD
tara:strand:- start:500 stop:685 length:186 start_codon:yes stop_codon:yes gene_type:complete